MSIALEQVSFTYYQGTSQELPALKNIQLTIADGTFTVIMGHTGCGKTTLIQLLAGLLTPTKGRVLLNGEDIHSRHFPIQKLRRQIGIVFQYPEYQLFETTVEKDVAFGLKYLPLSKVEKKEQIKIALETMGFSYEKIRKRSPLALSGGEKRRVAVAGILAIQPKTLILDEPVAGLDPLSRKAFLDTLQKLHMDGTTILLITHDADIAAEYADRLLILEHGCLKHDSSPHVLFTDLEAMKALHLDVSTPRRIAHLLKQQGKEIPQNIIRFQELYDFLR